MFLCSRKATQGISWGGFSLGSAAGEASLWVLPRGCLLLLCTNPRPFLTLQHHFSAVMHFAGLKAVGESVQKPLEYYRVNLTGTIRLLEVSGSRRAVCGAGGHRDTGGGLLAACSLWCSLCPRGGMVEG